MSSVLITKRNGKSQKYQPPKQARYIDQLRLIPPKLLHCSAQEVSKHVSLGAEMTSIELANHIAEVCASLSVRHWEYSALGGRVVISMLHRQTPKTFVEAMAQLQGTLSDDFINICLKNQQTLNDMICHDRDFQYDIMGIRTLQRSYLLKKHDVIVERPQYMLMRVAVALHGNNMDMVQKTYDAMSKLEYTHATPTLFHAGLAKQQLASCFLMTMTDDSIDGIFETLKRCALISKGAGGIGLSISNIRGSGLYSRDEWCIEWPYAYVEGL